MNRLLPVVLSLACVGCAGSPKGVDVERARQMRMAGDDAYKRTEYRDAIDCYTSAIQFNPDYADAYLWRGNAWSWLADHDDKQNTKEARMQAVADYTGALQRNPASFDAYFNRGLMAAAFKQYLPAVKDFLECTKIRQGDPEPHFLIGQIYESKFENMGLRAMEHYETYVRLGGTNDDIVDKVKAWQALKPKAGQPGAAPPSKQPTPEEEEKAKEMHAQMTALIGQGKSPEAFKIVDDLLTKFGHTKYVRDRLTAFTATHRALKPAEKPPEKK